MLRPADTAAAARPPADRDSQPLGRPLRLAGALALLGLAWVTLAAPSASRILGWPLALLTLVLWLLPLLALATGLWTQPAWRLPSRWLLAGVALLALGAVVSAARSPFADASLPRIWPTLGGVALFLCLHHAWSAPASSATANARGLARLLGAAGAALVLASLVQWSHGRWPLPWIDRNTAPFGHSTYTAGAVILFLPWIALQAWNTRGAGRVAWLVVAAAALVVLTSTSSRGGVLALGVMAAAAVAAALALSRWPRRRKLALVLVAAGLGLAAVLANPRLRELVLHRRWGESATESNVQRQAMLAAGWQLGRDRPLLGWGPGTVPLAYPRVRARLDAGTENVLQLHNTPAQLWATLGLVGAVALGLLVVGALLAAGRARRTPVVFAAAASLLGFAVVALTDHQLDLPVMTALVAAGLAVLTAAGHRAGDELRPARAIRGGVLFAVAALPLVAARATRADLRARHRYDAALTALEAGRTDEFLRRLDAATAVTPRDPFFQHQAAARLLEERAASSNRSQQRDLAETAAKRLEASLATGVHQEFAHFNLGWLLLELGQPVDAAPHFRAAARLVPDKGGVYFGLGLAERAAGHAAAALRAFALETLNDPRSITSPAWELPALAALQPAVLAEVDRLYGTLRPALPAAAAIAAWTHWWAGDNLTPATPPPGFNAASARFAAALPAMARGEPVPVTSSPWTAAYAAWRAARTGTSDTADAFLAVAGGDRAFAAALARRARRHRDSFATFLVAPTEDEPALIRLSRHQRTGYGMLALHPEGPPLHDLYIVQDNRVASDLAAGLFPAKGWLPGRFLLALLPDNPR